MIYDYHTNYKIILPQERYMTKGISGLVNLGNTCFMASIIQCISNTISLTDYFLSNEYITDTRVSNDHVLISFIHLLQHMWETNQVLKPSTFVRKMSKIHDKYFTLEQQDSHEFLLYLLEIIHLASRYKIDIIENTIQKNDLQERLYHMSIDAWKKTFNNTYSIITKTFYGSFLNTRTCKSCNDTNYTFELNNCTSIPIYETIHDSLDSFFNPIALDNIVCEKCKGKEIIGKVDFWSSPNYLVFHLKKTPENANITFPIMDLDLTRYHSDIKCDTNKYIYDLYAVNYHRGSMSNGHYWSACKNLDGKWYKYNDANTSRIKEESIVSKDAYLLFYRRKFMIPID